ncbi:rho guanine nucleotide exchange factor 40 isoform X2 [Drosophila kikkawai]|uniref:Rho guanine nucleotide exchange factor 40 isoform X2 n=1 Tax=Drosophila kikkawai TaxID=30033 RepID=A0ABM4GE26_DROKI
MLLQFLSRLVDLVAGSRAMIPAFLGPNAEIPAPSAAASELASEIANYVTSWLGSDGADNLQKFSQLQWDNESQLRTQEQEFEKYYFIAMKHLAKGRDLHAAALKVSVLNESANNLKTALDQFAQKLELAHERYEAAARLLHLLTQHQREAAAREELQRLADQLGASALLEKHWPAMRKSHSLPAASSTPAPAAGKRVSYRCSSASGSSFEGGPSSSSCSCWRESRNLDDMDQMEEEEELDRSCGEGEEQQSKIADSGVGVCDNCERNPKLARICSCQSLNEKSHDELMEDECFDRPSKRYMDMHSPMEANAHLQCHGSSLELPKLEELSCLDPKIQKTLLLIMREMIGTERDYVRSLYYVIENYIDELLREDIPQPLRGQRNVIFGNIEKIFEFHNSHFLGELERYELNPLKVGAAFLEMESKFYLYALYNKNKPKSDTLLSEYGSSFFKPKQIQLQDKLDLASYLLKPVQRMGKYALLLQQLVKACRSVEGAALQEIAADVEELQRAEEMVKFQLRHGNDLLAMDSLRDCDVNVKEQGRLLRQNEFLVWQGRGGKKTLRQVFLFEELVLFSKARRFPDHKNLDIYIYKNSIKTSDIGLTAHTGDSATKFEIWFRKRKPDDTWMLQCMSEDIKNSWTEEISKLLWKQAKRNREIRLAEMSSMGIGSKPCLDIRPSNNQISDRSIPLAQLNKTPKLRHSEPGKGSMRRPNSLISESSLSSGTSTTSGSSISGASSSGHHDGGGRHSLHFGKLPGPHNTSSANNCSATLELINETQALKLVKSSSGGGIKGSEPADSEGGSSSGLAAGTGKVQGLGSSKRHHKRSTTIVSQLSMESGIVSDMFVTPDQEQSAAESSRSSWSTSTSATASAASTSSASTVILRRYRSYAHAAESASPDGGK